MEDLEKFLGMPIEQLNKYTLAERSGGEVGSHLKSSSASDWWWDQVPNVLVGDNSSGFNAIAAGKFYETSRTYLQFNWEGQDAIFWTSSQEGSEFIARDLKYGSHGIARWTVDQKNAFSVRCVKNDI